MHIDLNSCFASVEQQANPLLRGVPLAVTNTVKEFGCILAASVEAKLYGVRTGMTIDEGRRLCPYLVIRIADPNKYRQVHHSLGELLSQYSPKVTSLSIDEYCLDFSNTEFALDIASVARDIKRRIKVEIGSHLRTSVGISTNRNLAKLASGLHKPDGLDVIDSSNCIRIFSQSKLQDFCGINKRNEARLNRVGIFTGLDFAHASLTTLNQAFESVLGRYWYLRLRGYEVDDLEFARGSFGQSFVLPRSMGYREWRPILAKLSCKASRRLRRSGYLASGVSLALRFGDHTSWHTSQKLGNATAHDPVLLASLLKLYETSSPKKPVKKIALSFFALEKEFSQLSLLGSVTKQRQLLLAFDKINDLWGENTLAYGSLSGSSTYVRDAIAFGK